MAKPEWGTKRLCPKCGVRFYDMNKAFPLTCVACGCQFEPEVVLKSKQPVPAQEAKVIRKPIIETEEDSELAEALGDEDLDLEDEDEDESLLGDVDDLDDDDMSDMIDKPRSPGED